MIRPRCIAALALITVCSVNPALADDWSDCAGSDPDRSAAACTRLIEIDGGYVDPSSLPRILSGGDRGPEIEALQSFLKSQGYDVGEIDGVYGRATQQAILTASRELDARFSQIGG